MAGSSFNPQGWVIKTGAGDDTVGLAGSNGYYDRKESVDLGAGDDIGVLRIGRYLTTGMVVHGNDWLSFRQAYFYKYTTDAGVDCFTPGPGNEPNNLYSVCGNNYKMCSVRSDLYPKYGQD